MLFISKSKRIYLDYASATPVSPEVQKVMEPYFSQQFGNAGSIHAEGVAAKMAISGAREKLARTLHTRQEGIVFTGSGTESNNLAILGTIAVHHKKGVPYENMEIISTAIEHPSVLEVLKYATSLGVGIVYADVDETGVLDAEALKRMLSKNTILVSFAYVNSEVGTVQHVNKIARIIRDSEKVFATKIVIHVDAAQAPLWLPCTLDSLSVDILSLDAGKCYGPKGIGVLVYRHGVELLPIILGGGQEGGLRSGTENTALIVGAATAICRAQEQYKKQNESISKLRDVFIKRLTAIEGVVLNGSQTQRVANNINISVPGIDSEFAVISLDQKGIACSTKSACGGAKGEGSDVVRILAKDEARAHSTIRFSLGEATTLLELDKVASILEEHISRTRMIQQKLTLK